MYDCLGKGVGSRIKMTTEILVTRWCLKEMMICLKSCMPASPCILHSCKLSQHTAYGCSGEAHSATSLFIPLWLLFKDFLSVTTMQAKLVRSGEQIFLKPLRTKCGSFPFFSWKKCRICCHGNQKALKTATRALEYHRKIWITCYVAPTSINSVPKWWNLGSSLALASGTALFRFGHLHLLYQRLQQSPRQEKGAERKQRHIPDTVTSLAGWCDINNIPEPLSFSDAKFVQ